MRLSLTATENLTNDLQVRISENVDKAAIDARKQIIAEGSKHVLFRNSSLTIHTQKENGSLEFLTANAVDEIVGAGAQVKHEH